MSKAALREELKQRRAALSPERKEEASARLLSLLPTLAPYQNVLSFMSLPQEIDTSSLNRVLALTGRLLLPKVTGDTLTLYHISDLEKELEKQAFGLLEPIPSRCREASRDEVDAVLVPALAFDSLHQRIGYGKGYYDRLLALLSGSITIGIGFKEQLLPLVPTEPTDYPLHHISLF